MPQFFRLPLQEHDISQKEIHLGHVLGERFVAFNFF